LKANCARASEKPGNGWYLEPAFATNTMVVVGVPISRLAILIPAASAVSYWRPRVVDETIPLQLLGLIARQLCRRARGSVRPKAFRNIIIACAEHRPEGKRIR
jgi:hypothetical protein